MKLETVEGQIVQGLRCMLKELGLSRRHTLLLQDHRAVWSHGREARRLSWQSENESQRKPFWRYLANATDRSAADSEGDWSKGEGLGFCF